MNKHIELAKKIKALADRGVGGEKTNAEAMLKDLIEKHGLSLEDIDGEEMQLYYFKVKKEDFQLWLQIVSRVRESMKVYGQIPTKQIKRYHLKGNYAITCTASEYIEVEAMLNIYYRLYKSELDIFFTAFCTANDLLVISDSPKSTADFSAEEMEKWLRANAIATQIKKEQYRKQLEHKEHNTEK